MYWICFVSGLLTLGMLGLQIASRESLKRTGVRVIGTVIQLDEDDGAYRPTIQFRTLTDEVRYVTDTASSAYKGLLHQEVPVIYNPKNLNEFIFLHRDSVILNMVFLGIGVFFLGMALFLWLFDR
jgi:hypothetical protein